MRQEKTHILLVEDDEGHAGLIRRAFEPHSEVELTVAASLEEARGCLEKSSPQIVVADLMLPDGKGTALLAGDESETDIPVVVMTSFGNEEEAVEAMKAGALDYVVKSATMLADIPRMVDRALREWGQVLGRRQAETQLREERNRAQKYLDIAAVILLTLDPHGVITLLNRKGHEVLGYVEGGLIGRNWFDTCLPTSERHEVRQVFEQVLAGKLAVSDPYEHRVVTKSGEERIVAWRNTLLCDEAGAIVGTLGSGEDITEHKRMEMALQEAYREMENRVEERTAELRDSEAKFRALFESSNDAVLLLDEKCFFDCNDAALGIFGCSTREEFIGKHPSELSPPAQLNGDDSLAAAEAKMALAVETGAAHFEWLHRRIDGAKFEADVLLSRMDLQGKTVLQAVVRDISQRKRAEEAVLRERATLRRLLESSDRDRKLTAYEIHDGFAQHIAGAKMQLEAASRIADENPEAAARAYQRGQELLTRGLAEARRLISGLRPPILDEAGVVAAIEHLTRDPTMQEGPEVGFVFDAKFGRLPPLLENTIFRIVQESVTNARRYSESDTVRIRLTRKNGRIQLEIEDWGIGFDPDHIAETSFGIGGIKERARLLGGQATIDSAPGKGTRIVVELPQASTS